MLGLEGVLRNNRIGTDLDRKSRFLMLKMFIKATYIPIVFAILTTETRHGFHLRIFTSRQVTMEEALHIRRMLGDDPERLGYDELKIVCGLEDWVDTLFEEKMDYDGKVTVEEEINPLMEASLTKIPSLKRR